MIFTTEDIMSHHPCYKEADVKALIGEGKSLEQILNLPIPPEDRIWVGCQLLDPEILKAWGLRVVELHIDEDDPEWSRKWLSGEDRSAESALNSLSFAGYIAINIIDGCYYTACVDSRVPFTTLLTEMKECLKQPVE